jgi:hypothetical protein
VKKGNKIRRSLKRIEGRLDEIPELAKRIGRLEVWQAWLRGAWAALVTAYAYLGKSTTGK